MIWDQKELFWFDSPIGILSLGVIPCVLEESDNTRLQVRLALISQTKSAILN
jgi:hypothetical protein